MRSSSHALFLFVPILSIALATQRNTSSSSNMDATPERPRVYEFYQSSMFFITIGLGVSKADMQLFLARLDWRSSAWLVVMDVSCGREAASAAPCPRYCRDDAFRSTYCSPLCRQIHVREQLLLCDIAARRGGYNSSRSHGFRPTNRTIAWSASVSSPRRMFGEFGQDELHVYGLSRARPLFDLGPVEFIRGLLMTKSYTRMHRAFFGLLPSPDNLIVQLHRLGRIPRAQIAFFRNQLFPERPGTFGIQFGALENERNCDEWKFHRSAVKGSWILRADRLLMNGQRFGADAFILMDGYQSGIHAPPQFIERLLAAGVLLDVGEGCDKLHYAYAKSRPLNLQLRFENGQRFEFDEETLAYATRNRTHGCSYFYRPGADDRAGNWRVVAERRRYTDAPNWVFGHTFLASGFCYGFDYGRGEMALAEQRIRPPDE